MPPDLFEAVDRRDVRMIERGEDFRLALEAREPIGIAGDRGRQDLDRDLPLQLGVGRRYTSPMPPAPICAVTS